MLGLGAFAIGTNSFVVAGVLGGLAADLGVSLVAAGWTVTAFALAYAIGSPLLSSALGTQRPQSVLRGSLMLFGLFSLLSAVAPSLETLLVARVLSALAAGLYMPAAGAAAISAVPPSHRGRALAVVLGGASAAMVLGAPLGVLLAATSSWRLAFWLVAGLAAIAVLGLVRSQVSGEPVGSLPLGARLRPLTSPAVTGALGVTLLLMIGDFSMYTYLDPLLGGTVGPEGLGILIGLFGAGGVIGTWWGGTAADRWGGRRTVLATGGVLTAVVAVSPLLVPSWVGAVAFVLVWGMAGWAFVPAQQHRLIGLDAGPVPLLLALHSSTIHLGVAAGALLGGMVVDDAGADRLWLLAVVCCGAGLALHAALTREQGGRR